MTIVLKSFFFFFFIVSSLFGSNLQSVKLQLQWKHQFEFAGFYAAKEKGYYKDIGLDVTFLEYDGKSIIEDNVLNGKADFGLSYSSIISDYLKGKDIVFVANYFKQSPLVLITQKDIKTPEQLKGKKVMGVSDQIDNITLKLMLEKFGISSKDIINIPTTFNIDDFLNKKVDAMSVFITNEIYQLDKLGVSYNIFNPSLYGYEYYDMNLFTSKEFASTNNRLVQQFKEASNKGWEYALKNKEEIVELIIKKYNTQNKSKEALLFEANQIEQLMFTKSETIGDIAPLRVELIAKSFVESGYVDNKNLKKLQNFIFKDSDNTIHHNLTDKKFKKQIIDLACTIATPFYNVYDKNVIELLRHYLEKNKNIEAIKLYDTMLEQPSIIYYKKEGKDIFKTNQDFEKGFAYPQYEYSENIVKNGNTIGILTLYSNNRLTQVIDLTPEEKEFLKKNPTINVHNELDWPPYNYNVNGKPQGFYIDYIYLLASKLGIDVEFISGYTWNQFLEFIKENKKIDVMLNIAKTEDREKFLSFTTPVTKFVDAMILKKGNDDLRSLKDFEGRTIAVVKGFYEEELLSKYYPNINLKLYDNTLQTLKAVTFAEVDGTINSFAVANYFIKEYSLTNIEPKFEIKDTKFTLDLHIATNKNNKILTNILEKGKHLISEDELLKLKKKWIGISEKENINQLPLTLEEQEYLNKKYFITMCVDPDWEPYEQIDKNGKHIGLVADFIKLVEKKVGKKIKLVKTKTWTESLEFAQNGKCEILSFLNQSKERSKYLNFTPILYSEPDVIISRDEVTYLDDFKSLTGKTVGLVKGYQTDEFIQKNFPKIKIQYIKNHEEGINLVSQGKLDVTINSLLGTIHLIKKSQLLNVKIAGKTERVNNYRIGIIKKEKILHSILSKAVSSLTQNEKDKTLSNWGSIKFEKQIDYFVMWQIILVSLIIIFIFFYWNQKISKTNKLLNEAKLELEEKNKQLEASMQQTKMAALGEMIGNIAHQWRQPLSVISTASTGMQLQKEHGILSDEEFHRACETINNNSQYLSNTINTFRDYIKGEKKKAIFNLGVEIKSLLSLVGGMLKNNDIQLIIDSDESIEINGYKNELIEALINIVNNAKDAILENNIKDKYIFISTYREKNNAVIKIKDNGSGIKKEIIKKVFEPYFTTKHQSQGTGLGLYMTHKIIVESMDGNINVKNIVFYHNGIKYEGVEFILKLPLK